MRRVGSRPLRRSFLLYLTFTARPVLGFFLFWAPAKGQKGNLESLSRFHLNTSNIQQHHRSNTRLTRHTPITYRLQSRGAEPLIRTRHGRILQLCVSTPKRDEMAITSSLNFRIPKIHDITKSPAHISVSAPTRAMFLSSERGIWITAPCRILHRCRPPAHVAHYFHRISDRRSCTQLCPHAPHIPIVVAYFQSLTSFLSA